MGIRDKLYHLRLKEKKLLLEGNKEELIKLREEIKKVRKEFALKKMEENKGEKKIK